MALPPLDESRPLRYATVFYMYVMQGIPAGFALTAVANRLAAAGVSSVTIGRFVALVGVPWTVQFIWGPVLDRFQGSRMGRRKPWVFFAQILAVVASLGVLLVKDPARQVGTLMVVFFVHSVFASVQDAGVDAMAITVSRPEERARVNAYMRAGLLVGDGVGAAVLATIMGRLGFTAAAVAQSCVLFGFTIVTFLIREHRGDTFVPWGRARRPVVVPDATGDATGVEPPAPAFTTSTRAILVAAVRGMLAPESRRLFGAIWAVFFAGSVYFRVLSTHLVQRLHWGDTALSVLSGTWGTAAAAAAILLTGAVAERLGARRLLLGVVGVIAAYLVAFNLLAPLWPNAAFTRSAYVVWHTFDPGYCVASFPVLMALCRSGVEGSQFTAYMALVNFSDVVGNYVAGYALAVFSAPAIGLACAAVVLVALEVVRRSTLGERADATLLAPPPRPLLA